MEDKGYRCGLMLRVNILGYTDDVTLTVHEVEEMTARLTAIANISRDNSDMMVNMSKTFSQHMCTVGIKLK